MLITTKWGLEYWNGQLNIIDLKYKLWIWNWDQLYEYWYWLNEQLYIKWALKAGEME
jgi:hypothetical protein